MDTTNLQYVTDENGEKTAVVVPIEAWNEMIEERSNLKQDEIAKGLKEAFEEIKAAERGETTLMSAEDFFKCL